MKISGIYQIQSKIKPERIYIGSAINIQVRWRDHLYRLKKHTHDNQKLQNHFNKYGKNDLVFSILIGCAKEDLLITEQFYIDSKKCWFNICLKAGSSFGVKRRKESIEKDRLVKLGLKHTKEHNDNISKSQLGNNNSFFNKHHLEESNEKRREWNKQHPVTKETRIKQRESLIKYYELKKLNSVNSN